MYKNKTVSLFIIMLCSFVSFNLNAKVQTKKTISKTMTKEELIKISVKSVNELRNSEQIKSLLLSMTKNIDEAKKVETLYDQMFGKRPVLKSISVIDDTLYVNGEKQAISISILPDRILYKNGLRVATFMKNETSALKLLKEYNKLYEAKAKTAGFLFNLVISEAHAQLDKDTASFGFLIFVMNLEKGKRVYVSGNSTKAKPSPYDTNVDTCSGSTANLQKFLNELLSKDKKTVAEWPKDFSFAIQNRVKTAATPEVYQELAKKWVKELKAKGDTKKIKCNFSDPSNVRMNFDKYLNFSSGQGKYTDPVTRKENQSKFVKGNIQANVDWFGLSDVNHYSYSFLESEVGASKATDGKGFWCELDYRDVLIKDMGFALHEVCKMALKSPEEYPEIEVVKPNPALLSNPAKTKDSPLQKGINSKEAEAVTID